VPVYEWYHTKFGEYVSQEMRDFCASTDIVQFEGATPFLKKRGWALLNLALWWKQYIGPAAGAARSRTSSASLETQAVPLRSMPVPAEKSA
jgi:hypothetical protein